MTLFCKQTQSRISRVTRVQCVKVVIPSIDIIYDTIMSCRRAIHFVFKIGRRNKAVGFYKNVLGMKVTSFGQV